MKQAPRLLILTVLLTICLAGAALGAETTAEPNGSVTYDGTTYTASCSQGLKVGNQYVLLVVEQGQPISQRTVQYIDQMAATEQGVQFTFLPRSTPACTVLLGGVFADGSTSPITMGALQAQGAPLTGSLQYLGDKTAPAVGLTGPNDRSYTATVTVQSSGKASYRFDAVPPGDYQLTITKIGHLPYSKAVHVGTEALALESVKLLGGDVDNDHRYINTSDLSALLLDFKQPNAAAHATNINEDGYVNVMDLSTLLLNFKKSY